MKNEQATSKRQFKPGDVVRHIDGIPMTIEGDPYGHDGKTWVRCVWFDGRDQVRRGVFEEEIVFHYPGYAGMVNMRVPPLRVPPLPPAREINAAMAAGVAAFESRWAHADRASLSPQVLAEGCYVAYGRQAGWKNFLGHPMPAWEDLPDHIRDCWEAVARFAIGR